MLYLIVECCIGLINRYIDKPANQISVFAPFDPIKDWNVASIPWFTKQSDVLVQDFTKTLRWRHNDHAGVSNHQPHGCLLNRLFRRNSKKTSKLRVTGLCAGNSPGTGEFPAQMASYAENVSTWWRHHDLESARLRDNKNVLSWHMTVTVTKNATEILTNFRAISEL